MKKILLIITTVGYFAGHSSGYAQCAYDEVCYPAQYSPDCFESSCCRATFEGWYIGGNIGWAFQDRIWVDRDAWIDNFSQDWTLGSVVSVNDGVTVGLQTGYNLRCGCSLFGLEIDANWADLDERREFSPTAANITVLTLKDEPDWFGTIRGRAGIVCNNLLLYVSAGAAWAHFKHHWAIDDPNATPTRESFRNDETHWGLALGTGVEWLFCSNISVKAESLYLKFSEQTTTRFSPNGAQDVTFDLIDSIWIARVGVNFYFSCFRNLFCR